MIKSQIMFLAWNRGIPFGIAQKESKKLGQAPLSWAAVVKPNNRANRLPAVGLKAVVGSPFGKLLVYTTAAPGLLRSGHLAAELRINFASAVRGPFGSFPVRLLYKRTSCLSRGLSNEAAPQAEGEALLRSSAGACAVLQLPPRRWRWALIFLVTFSLDAKSNLRFPGRGQRELA